MAGDFLDWDFDQTWRSYGDISMLAVRILPLAGSYSPITASWRCRLSLSTVSYRPTASAETRASFSIATG
jgi:hypothetical protein